MIARRLFIAAAFFCFCITPTHAQQPEAAGTPPDAVSQNIEEARLIHSVMPDYPETVKKQNIAGQVVIMFTIEKDGTVAHAIAVGKDLAGHESVNISDAKLRQAAVDAVKQWRYRPYLVNGVPAELDTSAVLPFDFRQPGSSSSNPPASVFEGSPQFGEFTKVQTDRKVLQARQIIWEEPKYPQMARAARIEGIVVIRVLIDKEGHVAQEKAVMGHPVLVQAAWDAVKQWVYLPFLVDGEAAAIESTVVLRFRMDGVKQD